MKHYFNFILLLLLFSCGKEEIPKTTDFNIEGKWNLESFEGLDGVKKDDTYIIFIWYEKGLEFVDEEFFYPRYGPPNYDEWFTNFNNGSGNYKISNGILTLSYQDINYDYTLKYLDENTIEISNYDSGENPWTGTWVLIRNN